ncbi:MAG: molybdopterin converting factor subunit 1 [Planctomycetales bacterium]|nr:molybdopterin converting factor subunit 1 [Planctomycetales bacterium]
MRVRVLFFAAMRERIGRESETVDVPAGATVAHLLTALAHAHPAVRPLLDRSRVALGDEFVPPDARLSEGGEAAVIPPVSGGTP